MDMVDIPSGYVKLAIENGHWNDVSFPIHSMVIFNSYLSLPEVRSVERNKNHLFLKDGTEMEWISYASSVISPKWFKFMPVSPEGTDIKGSSLIQSVLPEDLRVAVLKIIYSILQPHHTSPIYTSTINWTIILLTNETYPGLD